MPRYQDPGHHGQHAFTAFIGSDSFFVRFSLAPRFDPAQYLKTSHSGSRIAGEGRAGKRLNRTVERVGHFPGRELYKMPVIRASGSKLSIVFRRAIPESEKRLRSESREGRLRSVKLARLQEAPVPTTLSDLTAFPKAL
jgi:hypothetical protein